MVITVSFKVPMFSYLCLFSSYFPSGSSAGRFVGNVCTIRLYVTCRPPSMRSSLRAASPADLGLCAIRSVFRKVPIPSSGLIQKQGLSGLSLVPCRLKCTLLFFSIHQHSPLCPSLCLSAIILRFLDQEYGKILSECSPLSRTCDDASLQRAAIDFSQLLHLSDRRLICSILGWFDTVNTQITQMG